MITLTAAQADAGRSSNRVKMEVENNDSSRITYLISINFNQNKNTLAVIPLVVWDRVVWFRVGFGIRLRVECTLTYVESAF